ncbi:proton-coupled folate transporter-like isoform X2 [Pomacea canaliculata]|uniref:proton-coupled folate transporter-like isoform X2 n=1 Tax=Pomacea canaliculata TaxID=400727 RepID=UPI000D73206F|nr:proton-coupled folate transporter-like isoform X2 [Pomacea canaliculata]
METESVRVPAVTDKEKRYQADEDYKTSQGDEQSDDKADKREVQKHKTRWIVTAFTALLCYVFEFEATLSLRSQYVYQRIAHDYYNVTNDTRTTISCSPDDVNDTMADKRDRIQADTSQMSIFLVFTTFIPALFLCLFMGSYSDYLGRRFLVLMSLSGSFLKALTNLLIVWLNINLNYLYLANLLDGLCGTVFGLLTGIQAAMADVTITMTEFALTSVVLEGSIAISGALSQISVGFLIRSVGFIGPAILCCVVSAIACVIIFCVMPETLKRPVQVTLNPLVHLRKVFGFYILEGSSVHKGLFWCGLLVSALLSFCQSGQVMIEILYMLNAPLCWDSVKLGVFTGVRQFSIVITSIVTLKVLQRYTSHVTIGILAMFSGAAAFALEAFASADWMMYLTPVLGLAYMCTTPVIKTLMSSMTTADRQGQRVPSFQAWLL